MIETDKSLVREGLDIAIIGISCRFPGARNADEFWRNLHGGVESIKLFTQEEMERFGISPAALRDPDFVRAGAIIEDIDCFDAAFFGYSPKEAEITDPQQRIFLECAWEALENSGYCPDNFRGLIGVYAGASLSTYLLFNVLQSNLAEEEIWQAMIGNDKDFVSTRVSYELNLRGPSLDIQTACSTSLAAVHLACQGLLNYQCDMALAGGVSVQVPQRTGYFFQKGGINSPDGHCRAFDARAQGTVFGSGVGLVVLKRLEDALSDRDCIQAVIKGSAVNNDGSSKVGYTAPSVDGQAEVIALAQAVAGVEAETISYVEAHGTGTPLGDPIEIQALTKAFRATTSKRGFCAIGSVKTNIGHLDAAAGIAGLIKTTLSLKHRRLPASLHYERANEEIGIEQTPFYVNDRLREWESPVGMRRAGVSAFGVGGTNAHVILEEAPRVETGEGREWKALMISGKSEAALEEATVRLKEYLSKDRGVNLSDVAYTLQVGRKSFEHRRVLICRNREEALKSLETLDPQKVFTARQEREERPIVFLFPGGGAQYLNMGHELYQVERTFRAHVDACSEILRARYGFDARNYLYPDKSGNRGRSEKLTQASVALPALFITEYALARLWMSWGVNPEALIGHSLGEYVAACLAGVFSLEDALSLVVIRGRLFEKLPRGAMLAVALSEQEVESLIDDNLSVAAVNAPKHCVISGPVNAIERVAHILSEKEIEYRKIQIDVAAHSKMVSPILREFGQFVKSCNFDSPQIPFISNISGRWITEQEAANPDYWVTHLRETVRFGQGVAELISDPKRALLEVGPGRTLIALANLQMQNTSRHAISSMRHPYDIESDQQTLQTAMGKLWLSGAKIDWREFYANEDRGRTELPSYPFQRQRYWIEPAKGPGRRAARFTPEVERKDFSDWFYIPSWKRALSQKRSPARVDEAKRSYMVLCNESELSRELVASLKRAGRSMAVVRRGSGYHRDESGIYNIAANDKIHYLRVLEEEKSQGRAAEVIIHLWSSEEEPEAPANGWWERFSREQEKGLYSLLHLAQAKMEREEGAEIWVVTRGMEDVESGDEVSEEKATMAGAMKVMGQECENLMCRCIDLGEWKAGEERQIGDLILSEIDGEEKPELVAYRGGQRWLQCFEPIELRAPSSACRGIRERGSYLITGGLGGVGLLLASHLAKTSRARLTLISRQGLPEREAWRQWLASHDENDETSRKIKKAQAMLDAGAEVLICSADVANEQQMRQVIKHIYDSYGEFHGVIHAAGIAGQKAINLIQGTTPADCEDQFEAKAKGLYVLETVLRNQNLDFRLLLSSNASILGGLGSFGYSAANSFMDAFAKSRGKTRSENWISVNWDGWLLDDQDKLVSSIQTGLDRFAMKPEESLEAFERITSAVSTGQVVVSTGALADRVILWVRARSSRRTGASDERQLSTDKFSSRPALSIMYAPPSNEMEETVARIWQEALGIDRLGVNDNFFDLGGNSLIGLKIISRIRKETGLEISITALFEGPTISAFTRIITRNGAENIATYAQSRNRAERRREKRKRRRPLSK
jgi:acyl transferase domain-containing protein